MDLPIGQPTRREFLVHGSAALALPHILRQRWRTRARRRLSAAEFADLLRGFPLTVREAALKD